MSERGTNRRKRVEGTEERTCGRLCLEYVSKGVKDEDVWGEGGRKRRVWRMDGGGRGGRLVE